MVTMDPGGPSVPPPPPQQQSATHGEPQQMHPGQQQEAVVMNEYTLRCDDFKSKLVSALDGLWEAGDFVDVTLASEGQCLKAHRLVLSMGSDYFKSILRNCDVRTQHPVVFFRDISFADLKSVVDFLYTGNVTVQESHIESFLKTAESLRIDGLIFEQKPKMSTCPSTAMVAPVVPMPQQQPQRPQQQQEDEPLSLCVDNREDAKRGNYQIQDHEGEDDEEEDEEIAEPLCMTYEPPEKKPKVTLPATPTVNPVSSTAIANNGDMSFAAGGLMDFQQLDGIYDKVSSFCTESLLKPIPSGGVGGGQQADFAFDSNSQGFGRFTGSGPSGNGPGLKEVTDPGLGAQLAEDQAWDLNYRTSTLNCDSVTDLSNGGAGVQQQQHMSSHGCMPNGDDERGIGLEPLSLHQNPPIPVTTSSTGVLLPVISLNLSDGGSFVDSPSPAEMNLTVKRDETSNGHSDCNDGEMKPDLQSSSSSLSGSNGGSSSSRGKEAMCTTCGKSYGNIRSLQMHRKVHTGETTCPICNKVMNRTSDIKRHIQMVHYGKCAGGSSGGTSPVDNRMKY